MQESRGAALLLLGIAILAGGGVAAAPPPAQPPSYARDIAPLFQRWCLACHAGDEAHADLWLDSYAGVMGGGDAGPVVVAGKPDASLLVAKVERRHRPSMPPRRKLPATAIARIRAWVAAGAAE